MKIIYHFLSLIIQLRTYIEIKIFQKRFFILNKTGKPFYTISKEEKILVVVAHVVQDAHSAPAEKLDRLVACLDSLNKSLASFEYKIVLLSKNGYSLYEKLPSYLKDQVEMCSSLQEDPMFVQYDAFDVFKKNVHLFDYFMFCEDDILLNDGWFLEKIKKFNSISPYPNYIMLPHRFEYFNGVKYYPDQEAVINKKSNVYNYSEILKIDLGDVKFCMYENPHAGFYCLNKQQISLWIQSGYKWKNKGIAFGPLESAATYILFENFRLIKPHPDSINYFEVQHFGNKYILLHDQ